VDSDDYIILFYADFLDEPLKEGHFFGRETGFVYGAEIFLSLKDYFSIDLGRRARDQKFQFAFPFF
jgi:hypothetical protein